MNPRVKIIDETKRQFSKDQLRELFRKAEESLIVQSKKHEVLVKN